MRRHDMHTRRFRKIMIYYGKQWLSQNHRLLIQNKVELYSESEISLGTRPFA